MVHEEHMENLRDLVEGMARAGDVTGAVGVLTNRHPADQADILYELEEEVFDAVIAAFSAEQLADVLEFLDEDLRSRALEELPANVVAPILDRVDEDVAADIVQDLSPEQAVEIVPLLEDREAVQHLLTYPEESAGGRMSTDVVKLPRQWTVEQSINFLRQEQPDAEHPFYLYVVDGEGRLSGTVSLRSLVTASPATPIDSITNDGVISVLASEDQELATERMRHYNLLALPVVDDAGRLVGVITSDTSLTVQSEEATEDMFRMAGVGVEEWAFSPVWQSARRRIPWLSFNMVWAFAGAGVISLFDGTIGKVAALAIFMPMIAGQAGNAGIQTATIVVRSLALGEIQVTDAFRLLRKEWLLGLIKGTVFGGVLGLIAWVTQGSAAFGIIAGVAMLLNMFVASTTGVLLPTTLRRLGFDPATIAGVFDTMLTDLMGFLIYLGLATIFITKLQ